VILAVAFVWLVFRAANWRAVGAEIARANILVLVFS
jgi:hypothetical protein